MSFGTRETLIHKLKQADDELAWNDFYAYYSPYIAAVVHNLNVNASEIDDIVQKVMVVSWQKIGEFDYDRKRGLFRSWLVRIARNTVMNYRTSSTRNSEKLKYFSKMKETENDDFVEKEWRVQISKLAWKSIRGNYDETAQNAFDLLAQGKKNKEVAETLGIKQNTVAVYKKRIIESLRSEVRRLDSFLS
jgi:RNA polymerase sigma factor (sigma-70 family)